MWSPTMIPRGTLGFQQQLAPVGGRGAAYDNGPRVSGGRAPRSAATRASGLLVCALEDPDGMLKEGLTCNVKVSITD